MPEFAIWIESEELEPVKLDDRVPYDEIGEKLEKILEKTSSDLVEMQEITIKLIRV